MFSSPDLTLLKKVVIKLIFFISLIYVPVISFIFLFCLGYKFDLSSLALQFFLFGLKYILYFYIFFVAFFSPHYKEA